VVHVESHYAKRTSEATGFVYDAERGLVMTADHAVEAAPVIHVLLHDGTPLNGRIVGRAQCHDLAILKVTPAPPDLKQVTWGPAVHAGETVRAMTYVAPNGKFHDDMSLIQTRGAVAAVDAQATLTPLLPRFEALIAHQTPLSESSSGSPLVDDAGRVVGVNTLSGRRYGPDSPPGVNYAQSTRSVRALLAQLVPGEHAYFQGWSAEHACHMQMNELAGLPRGTSHHHPVGMPGMEDHGSMGGRDDAQHGHDGMGT
jgi:S1-C subfamily serine protease